MGSRLLHIIIGHPQLDALQELLREYESAGYWLEDLHDDLVLVRLPLEAAQTESVTDALEKRFRGDESLRIILLPIEAMLPREEQPEEPEPEEEDDSAAKLRLLLGRQVNREELYDDLSNAIRSWPLFLILTLLSTVLASLGLMRDDVAVIIGAMVIAPLLGPNMALALAVTLGDLNLGWRAVRINVTGFVWAVAIAAFIALMLTVDPTVEELHRRTQVGLLDVIIALSAGAAGSLAYTTGISTAFIGVMVAVALLPPTAACGLLIGTGEWQLATGAALLTAVNVACINLAAVLTFVIQGIRPRSWWEAGRARRATMIAVGAWIAVLVLLITVILIADANGFFDSG